MKINNLLFVLFCFCSTLCLGQSFEPAGTWIYGPTGTIKTIFNDGEGIKVVIDGDDEIQLFAKIEDNKYQSKSKEALFMEFKSSDLHIIFNTGTGKQNTWTRYNTKAVASSNNGSRSNTTNTQSTKISTSNNTGSQSFGTKEPRPFRDAVGLRFGVPTSVTYKKFINEHNAWEAFAGYRSYFGGSYLNFGIGYQLHRKLKVVDNLQWYFGVGVSGYKWSYDDVRVASNISIAPVGFLGWSYTFKNAPINISADWQPSFYLGSSGYYSGFNAGGGSLAIRYIPNR